jgi:spore germination protein GerM
VLAQQAIRVLHPDDPDTREIKLYWVVGERLQSELRRVPRTSASGAGVLNELLWGAPPQNSAGFTTALPSPAEVLSFAGRTAEWGPRVTLRKLALVDGVAQVDFSRELRAYDGDSLRASLIHAQITRTLLQFPQVRDVRITIESEGDTLLEP